MNHKLGQNMNSEETKVSENNSVEHEIEREERKRIRTLDTDNTKGSRCFGSRKSEWPQD